MQELKPLGPPVVSRTELTVSAIVVSYNTCDLTLQCLRALMSGLEGLTSEASEVWVVDNGSVDGSVGAIRASFPAVKLIDAGKNLGFGGANNLALRQARGKYLLLLNSDAFPREGAIAALIALLERRPEAAIASPRLLNADGTLQLSCFRFPSPTQAWLENLWIPWIFPQHVVLGDYRRWRHDSERCVDFAIGACLLIRRKVLDQVGFFDERFFMYQEETDLQKRIRDAGWHVMFTPTAEVVHFGGSSGKSDPARINAHFFESLDLYARKHHGLAGLILTRVAMVIGCSLRVIAWSFTWLVPGRKAKASSKICKNVALVWRQMSSLPRSS